MTLAVVQPTSLVAVTEQCNAIEMWADRCESVAELRDASNKLAAIDEYLSRTSTEGRARVAATQRRLEVRIGQLLGPAPTPHESGAKKGSIANEPSPLTKDERHHFRKMADHVDVVEDVIADSTDAEPASRNKVMKAITGRDAKRPAQLNRNHAVRASVAMGRVVPQLQGLTAALRSIAFDGVDAEEAAAWCDGLRAAIQDLKSTVKKIEESQ